MNNKDGVWRTIRGRRVFIANGEDLETAMKKSGKFENEKNTGKSTRAEVVDKIQRHIREYYENDEDLVRDMDAGADPRYDHTSWAKGERLVESGNFLIANADMNDTLNKWGINPSGKEYSEDKSYKTYKSLMGREMGKIYDNYQKQKKESMSNKTPKERARLIDKMNNNPLQKMSDNRIKEKQNTLNNDKAMVQAMKRKGIKEVQGMTIKDFENRIRKNEEYLKIAKK